MIMEVAKAGYKPSFCYYKQWGTKKKTGQGYKPVRQLRFSKSGNPEIGKAYATHYVDGQIIEKLKEEHLQKIQDSTATADL